MRLEHLLSAAECSPFRNLGVSEYRNTDKVVMRDGLMLSSLLVLTDLFAGGLAQLARALAWHARGHRFDPDILHFSATKVAK